MADKTEAPKGVTLEVLGQCMSNPKPASTHTADVEYRHLWSYAQQAALIAVSDQNRNTGCYELITCPERRAKRIAAHYADLYFKSAQKTKGKLRFQWPALAAFVVKDIVEAYRFSREEVLHNTWNSTAGAARNNPGSKLVSMLLTDKSPYDHVLITYAALVKGNLWLFMDIYPWLWFFLEYGINADGTLNKQRLEACLQHRDWNTYQAASKEAVRQLPFGEPWMQRLKGKLDTDAVYKKGLSFFSTPPMWSSDGAGYGHHVGAEIQAHAYCRANTAKFDTGYRMPPGKFYGKFQHAFYVMAAEHKELRSAIADTNAAKALVGVMQFKKNDFIAGGYQHMVNQYFGKDNPEKQEYGASELALIASHEQIMVLQPLIYNDKKLQATMDMNHWASRHTAGWISPKFQVVFAFNPQVKDEKLLAVFDQPDGIRNRVRGVFGDLRSLPVQEDRMQFVEKIALRFNKLMATRLPYMERELAEIRLWINA